MKQNSFGTSQTNLGTAQHHPVQQNLQLFEGSLSRANHSMLLNRRQDFVVPKTSLRGDDEWSVKRDMAGRTYMLHRTMTTI